MRLQALVGIAVAAVSVCAGQAGSTSAPQTPPQAGTSPYMSGTRSLAGPQVMLVGCVTSGATSFDPFTLASPTLVGTVTPGITSSASATSISLSSVRARRVRPGLPAGLPVLRELAPLAALQARIQLNQARQGGCRAGSRRAVTLRPTLRRRRPR